MNKKRLGSLLFWGFFIGIFYVCSVNQKKDNAHEKIVKNVKKDTCKILTEEEIIFMVRWYLGYNPLQILPNR